MKNLIFIALASVLMSSAVHAQKKPLRQQTPIMGWSSWNHFFLDIYDKLIRETADAMAENGMKEAGYQYVNIDDGYFGGRDENGKLICDSRKFPHGMKSVADYIHRKGLKAGIYTDAGDNTCGSHGENGDPLGIGVGLWQHEEQDIKMFFHEWGYDFLKVDWCGGRHLELDKQKRYTEISKLIRKVDNKAVFNVCCWGYPGEWVNIIADSWRISGDIRANFGSILQIIDLNEPLWRHAGPGHVNDMDMLQVGRGMSFEEDKTHFSMWCMMASPLLAGNDLRTMTPETLTILTNNELIAINQDPLVYQARRLRDEGDLEIWARPLKSELSGEVAVALLNRSDSEKSMRFDLSLVGIDGSAGFSVKDCWSGVEERTTGMSQSRVVPAHGVVILKLKGKNTKNNVFAR